jgi:hypothetical protein
MTLMEQMANIGSEVGRAARAKEVGNEVRLTHALDRALELFDLTLADPRWRGRRREIARAREIVCDHLVGDDSYGVTLEALDRYFLPFAVAARRSASARDVGRAQADADRAEIRRRLAKPSGRSPAARS